MFDPGVDFEVQEQEDPLNGSQRLAYGEDELQVYHISSTTKKGRHSFNLENHYHKHFNDKTLVRHPIMVTTTTIL